MKTFTSEITEVPLEALVPSPYWVRRVDDDQNILALAHAIQMHSLLEPLVVREADGVYRIISGVRRWYALRLLRERSAPCIVREMSEQEEARAVLATAVTQRALRLTELAAAVTQAQESGLSEGGVADALGLPVSDVASLLAVSRLIPAAQAALDREELPVPVAAALADLTPACQQAVLTLLPERGPQGALAAVQLLVGEQPCLLPPSDRPLTPRERNRNRLRAYLQRRCLVDADLVVRIARRGQGFEAIWDDPELAGLWLQAAKEGGYTCARCALRGSRPSHPQYPCGGGKPAQFSCPLYVDPGDDYLVLVQDNRSMGIYYSVEGETWAALLPVSGYNDDPRDALIMGTPKNEAAYYRILQAGKRVLLDHPLAQPCARCAHYCATSKTALAEEEICCQVAIKQNAFSLGITTLESETGAMIPRCRQFKPRTLPQGHTPAMSREAALAILKNYGEGLIPDYWDGVTEPTAEEAQVLAWIALFEPRLRALKPGETIEIPRSESEGPEQFRCFALEQKLSPQRSR